MVKDIKTLADVRQQRERERDGMTQAYERKQELVDQDYDPNYPERRRKKGDRHRYFKYDEDEPISKQSELSAKQKRIAKDRVKSKVYWLKQKLTKAPKLVKKREERNAKMRETSQKAREEAKEQ